MPIATADPDTTAADLSKAPAFPTGIDADSAVTAPLPRRAEAGPMDPAKLVIGHNVRPEDQIRLDEHPKEVESIRRLGVRDPILAERGPDGKVVVVDGQVRALIARTLGIPLVPVYIESVELPLEHPERQITRTVDQINLNDRRILLNDSARAAGVAYMLDLGASVSRIAEDLQTDPPKIRKVGKIARYATASALLDTSQLSLDQIELIADYEQLGDTEAVQKLSTTRRDFDYEATLVAADREKRRGRLTAALPYAASGHPVLPVDTDEVDLDAYISVDDLVDGDGAPVSWQMIEAEPSRWSVAIDLIDNIELFDPETGLVVDPDTVDFDAQGPDSEPAEGLRSYYGLDYRDAWYPTLYLRTELLGEAGLQRRVPNIGSGKVQAAADSPEAIRAAAEQAAAAERARVERQRVRKLNERGAGAKTRRLDFLRRVLALRTPPSGAAEFVAWSLSQDTNLLSGTRARNLALKLFNADSTAALTEKADAASTGRARVITLGLVLAAHESSIEKDLWRAHSWSRTTQPRYLHYLAEIGQYLHDRQSPNDPTEKFCLVDVELAAAGDLDPATIDLNPTTPAIEQDDNPSEDDEELAAAA